MNAKAYVACAFLMMLAAAGMAAAATWVAFKSAPAVLHALGTRDLTGAESCLAAAEAIGVRASTQANGSIVLTEQNIMTQPEMAFGRVSSVIAACRGFRMIEFCAGSGCGESQLSATISPIL